MENISLSVTISWAISFIFSVLFGTAAIDKFKSLQTPDWFVKQFENTFISKFPSGAKIGYWKIATFEAILSILFVASFFNTALLSIALVGSLFMFGALCFGLRLISDFQGSANMFIYFAAALISLSVIS